VNGRWHDVLPKEDSDRYENMVKENLGKDCARWLATGDM
jgi:aryl sulfotransferase